MFRCYVMWSWTMVPTIQGQAEAVLQAVACNAKGQGAARARNSRATLAGRWAEGLHGFEPGAFGSRIVTAQIFNHLRGKGQIDGSMHNMTVLMTGEFQSLSL